VSQHFIEALDTFLETVAEYKKLENMSDVHYICCPCVDCCNEKKSRDIEEIHEHLLLRGFMSGYNYWTEHSEYKEVVGGDDDVDETNHCWTDQNMAREDTDVRDDDDDDVDQTNHCWMEQNMAGEDTDVGGDDVDDLDKMLRNVESEFSDKSRNDLSDKSWNDKFSQIMKDYETPLFSGCKKEHNKLHVVLTLLQMKDSNGCSDKGFNKLFQFLNDLLSKANMLPRSMYQAKKIICLLGLEVEKIHTYRNECMLFHNEDAILEECRVCGTSRYKQNDKNIDKDDMGENKKVKRVPTKVAWYFSIIPHL
jgi:hypothetical protein